MPLIQVVMVLIVVGVVLWLINRFIPMQGTIKSILNVVVVICVALAFECIRNSALVACTSESAHSGRVPQISAGDLKRAVLAAFNFSCEQPTFRILPATQVDLSEF